MDEVVDALVLGVADLRVAYSNAKPAFYAGADTLAHEDLVGTASAAVKAATDALAAV